MGNLQLPKLISDGMVLQHGRRVHIWGKDEPGSLITLIFLGKSYRAAADEEGNFEIFLQAAEPGGPYEMQISDDAGEERTVRNILIGDVFFCSGQSNMELPMARVKDRYPEEIALCENDRIRTFKIVEHGDFHEPLRELQSGSWVSACADTILDFSAIGYFFAAELHRMTGVPVGFINASLGGSRLESWLGKDMIEASAPYPQLADVDLEGRTREVYEQVREERRREWLKDAEKYADDAFVAGQLAQNERQSREWHEALDARDLGLLENWQSAEDAPALDWQPVSIPFFFKDTALRGFIGSVWFRRTFEMPERLAGQPMHLWLGTIVDSDTVYVNGQWAGHTDYQYPPRKYEIPAGLLQAGKNDIVIRVKCENGCGRFTPGKKYALWTEDAEIDLRGAWQYRIGASCGQIPETDFVNWKPTGLYNGMTAPCHAYTIGGVLWYQGESNTHEPDNYLEGLKKLIGGYRRKWEDETLPFYIVQLPNFLIDLMGEEESWSEDGVRSVPAVDSAKSGKSSGWREIREKQRLAQAIPGVYMAVTMDLGEDNDLHPLHKKEIGRRLALLAAANMHCRDIPCESPRVAAVKAVRQTDCGTPMSGVSAQNGNGAEAPAGSGAEVPMENGAEVPAENGAEIPVENGGCDGISLGQWQITLCCEYAGSGLRAYSADKGDKITDFVIMDKKGECHVPEVYLSGAEIVLLHREMQEEPSEIRYCYKDTNSGALIYNSYGLPMSPFVWRLQENAVGEREAF